MARFFRVFVLLQPLVLLIRYAVRGFNAHDSIFLLRAWRGLFSDAMPLRERFHCCLLLRRSLADVSVTEILANLEEQMADPLSPLRNGNVTSAAKGVVYTTSVLVEDTLVNSASAIGLSVVTYQPKGFFGFASVILYTTEASGSVTLTVNRNHGTKGVMDIGYATSDGSATGGEDYVTTTGSIRFYDGDTIKTFDVGLLDNTNAEKHFKAFQVTLMLLGPINDGAGLRESTSVATVYVYDYGDGVVLINTTFPAVTSDDVLSRDMGFSSQNATKDSRSEVTDDDTAGWIVTDNGGEKGWVESIGFAAKDNVVGADEYGELLSE